jgi:hypothetical protein
MKFREMEERGSPLSSVTAKQLWHDRLAHINMKALKKTVRKYAATGIKADDLKGDMP